MNQISKLERKDIHEFEFDVVPENESDFDLTVQDNQTILYEDKSFEKFIEGPNETLVEEDSTPE